MLFLKIAVSLFLLGYSLRKINLIGVWNGVFHWEFFDLFTGTLISFFMVYLQAFRWKTLMGQSNPTPLSTYIRYTWMGYFFNLLIPVSVGGELAKAWKMGDEVKNKGRLVATVLQAKIMGLLSLVTMGIFFGFKELPEVARLPIIFLGIALFVFSTLPFWWPKAYTQKIFKSRFINVQAWLNGEGKSFKNYLLGFLLSFMVQGLAGFVHWYFFLGVGSEMTLAENFAFFPWLPVLMVLPITLGGVGIKEVYSLNTVAKLSGVTESQCIETSLASYLLVLLFAGVGFLVYLHSKKATNLKKEL